ncbi:hypothetical protein AM10699_00520 [Acaryochloris marina MBIC10699]|nr:hypothetical protein AM10699_00520 [Acaryochloris marina MBIC10699]
MGTEKPAAIPKLFRLELDDALNVEVCALSVALPKKLTTLKVVTGQLTPVSRPNC